VIEEAMKSILDVQSIFLDMLVQPLLDIFLIVRWNPFVVKPQSCLRAGDASTGSPSRTVSRKSLYR
jgi:hypothetical protein